MQADEEGDRGTDVCVIELTHRSLRPPWACCCSWQRGWWEWGVDGWMVCSGGVVAGWWAGNDPVVYPFALLAVQKG